MPTSSAWVFLGARASVPVATLLVERRLAERSWLVVGLAGSVHRESFDAPPVEPRTFASGITKSDDERGSLLLGLRRVVTRPGAIVDVSLLGSVEGGYGRFRRETFEVDFDGLERVEDGVTRDGSATGISVVISPRVELRLAF